MAAALRRLLFLVSTWLIVCGQTAAAGDVGVAGKLRVIGEFPEARGVGHTVTPLPDGRVFAYGRGHPIQSLDAVALNPRHRHAERNTVVPAMWDPKLHAWRRIENPPECQFLAYLHTATALSDDRILIAGGLCDIPGKKGDGSAHQAHREMSIWNDKSRQWERAPSLSEGRLNHTATLLADGRVLFVGGTRDMRTGEGVEPVLASVEAFRDGTVSPLQGLEVARARHTATRMADGSVVVVGGIGADGKGISEVEIWDPASQQWRAGPSLKKGRFNHTTTLLDDGSLLVVGGQEKDKEDLASVEMLRAGETEWTRMAPLSLPLRRHAALALDNGDVLVAGAGVDGESHYFRIMLWERASGRWLPAGNLSPDRPPNQTYLLVPSPTTKGEVLVLDGQFAMQWSRASGNAGNAPPHGQRRGFASATLIDGRIMLAGGHLALPGRGGKQLLDWVEIFDPLTGRFTLTGRLNRPRYAPSAIVLDDGRVLLATEQRRQILNPDIDVPQFAEVWDPVTGRWNAIRELDSAGAKWERMETFGKLHDGRVAFLFYYEHTKSDVRYEVMIWDPRTGNVETKRNGPALRILAFLTILRDGRILIIGGSRDTKRREDWRPELWDPRTGVVEQLPYPPTKQYSSYGEGTILRNGDVFWFDWPEYSAKIAEAGVWSAITQKWRPLPTLPIDDKWGYRNANILELSDGTLVVNNMWLRSGAGAWAFMPPLPDAKALLVEHSPNRLLALSTVQPVAYLDEGAGQWRQDHGRYLTKRADAKPVLLELGDGQVMVSGSLPRRGSPSETVTQIWNPQGNRWHKPGRLLGAYSGHAGAILLPSGQVLHLGQDSSGALKCVIGHPADDTWNYCESLPPEVGEKAQFSLGSMPDGRVLLALGHGGAYTYNEQTKQWLRLGNDRDENALKNKILGPRAWLLPDGCSISGPPFRIHNPKTKTDLDVSMPTGIKPSSARMVVLADGTVVVAGYPEGTSELGDGFFHRKVSCAGFEQQESDRDLMPGIFWSPSPGQAEVPNIQPDSTENPLVSGAVRYIWVVVAIIVPFLLYWPLRKLVLRANATDATMRLPVSVATGTRIVVYGLGALLLLAFLRPDVFRSKDAQAPSASAGLHPCRFVGTWASTRSGVTRQITLMGNGQFATAPIQTRGGDKHIYTGTWQVIQDNMIWQYNGAKYEAEDSNPIRQEGTDTFTLIEVNGEHSVFRKLDSIDSSGCSAS